MTIWLRYKNRFNQTLKVSIHTDELQSPNRADHEQLAISKLKVEYPPAHSIETLPHIR